MALSLETLGSTFKLVELTAAILPVVWRYFAASASI